MSWDFSFGSLSNFYELTYLKMALLITLCPYQSLSVSAYAVFCSIITRRNKVEEPVIFKVSVCNQDLKI